MEPSRVQWRLHEIGEAQHEIQNPTSADKLVLLGERLRLGPDTDILDIASGRGGPALLLAAEFGCRVRGIELREAFLEVARARARERRLDGLVTFEQGDASAAKLEPGSYDVALCLGATFVFGGLDATLAALEPVARSYVAVGEPYRRSSSGEYLPLAETFERLEVASLHPVCLIASSEDDWDRYEALHWQATEEWLYANPKDPDADELRALHVEHRDRYLRENRAALGWAIFAGSKRATA